MKTPLIIQFTTARSPITRLRDAILLTLCWSMWLVVLVAAFNSAEWDQLEHASSLWLGAQQAFVAALLRSFHVSSGYFGMVAILMAGFGLWSTLNLALASRRHAVESHPLSLATLARHFELDATLVATMQRHNTVIVQHANNGLVISLLGSPYQGRVGTDQLLLAA